MQSFQLQRLVGYLVAVLALVLPAFSLAESGVIAEQSVESLYVGSAVSQTFTLTETKLVGGVSLVVMDNVSYASPSITIWKYDAGSTGSQSWSATGWGQSTNDGQKKRLVFNFFPAVSLQAGVYIIATYLDGLPQFGGADTPYDGGCAVTDNSPPFVQTCDYVLGYYRDLAFKITDTWQTTPTGSGYGFENQDFGFLGNMFRDVIYWLFVPSQSSLEQFTNLWDAVKMKPPIGYFTTVKTAFDSLTTASGSFYLTFSGLDSGDSPLAPLKTGLIWILYIMLAFWILHRIRQLEI
jgi:hypothetical protein